MRILFGIQTTGHGHLVRSSHMVRRLRALGQEVDVLFSGPRPAEHWLQRTGEPFALRDGLTFVHERGRIRYLATTRSLRLGRFARDVASFPADGYDLVVTDYEPVTAWLARLRGLRSVGPGHLYAFQYPGVPLARGNPLTRTILRHFAPAAIPVGTHWDPFGAPLLPPMLTDEVHRLERSATASDRVLVYLNFEDLEEMLELLAAFPDWRFRYYARVEAPRLHGNVELLPIDRERFVADLAECHGVICNAGFSLPSEALHLGVRLLVKPLTVQLEQESNGVALERLGAGTVMYRMDPAVIRAWLGSARPAPRRYPDVMAAVTDWICAGATEPVASLSARLWAGTGGPAATAPSRLRAMG